jgi:type IV pilus modification protein PilV
MTKIRINGSARGFSLLEVLVAVVIVSVGLVALAALQLSLIRSSNTAKMQSTALSLGKQKIEQLRSFRQLSPKGTTGTANPCNSVSNTSYISLDTCTTTQAVGGVTYSVATTITRYVLDDTTFAVVGNTTTEAILSADTAHKYVLGRDFKKATVQVTWTDSTNATNALTLDDVVDGLDPVDSAKVAQNSSSLNTRPVQVIINNPSATPGVIAIPLATGDTVDTAATNPKPVIDSNATETRFNIYTYAGLSGGKALAQSEVETVLIGCTCDTAAAPTDSSTRGYRPTYWNGFRYVAPKLATYTPPAGQYTTKKVDESPYCDVCCRDHNDPVGTTTAKFSPFRATHTHYGLANDGVTLLPVGSNGQTIYKEACRLIRTDGVLRVAADYNDEYFNLLKTKNDGSTTEYAPDSTATSNYQNFVLDYLNAKVVTPTSSSAYNTPVAAGSVSTLESTRNINDPASITLQRTSDHKWLHSRGLYVDYLEPEALQAIEDAKANCVATSCTAAAKQTAVLELLPFTSINLTELTDWFPLVSDSKYVSISNGAFTSSTAYNGSAPVRGYVVPASTGIPSPAQTQNGTSTARNSNSGLQTLFDVAINNDEGSKTDTQVFGIPAGGSGAGGNFTVSYTGYSFPRNSAPALSGTNVTNCTSTKSGSNYTSACSSSAIGSALTLNATNYNAQSSTTSNIPTGISVTCTKSDGSSPITVTTTTQNKAKVYTCTNYQITAALNSTTSAVGTLGAVSNDGAMGESTPISFTTIGNNDVLNLTFTTQSTSYGYTCKYTTGASDATISAATCL